MSNILRNDINAAFEGFLEITKELDGEKIDLFFKASQDSWYHFGFENNKLITFSSNPEYNNFIANKSNAGKAKIGEFVYIPGDMPEAIDFIHRFRKDYLGIEEPYELYAPPSDEVVESDDFGAEEEEGFEEEEEDDEGF